MCYKIFNSARICSQANACVLPDLSVIYARKNAIPINTVKVALIRVTVKKKAPNLVITSLGSATAGIRIKVRAQQLELFDSGKGCNGKNAEIILEI